MLFRIIVTVLVVAYLAIINIQSFCRVRNDKRRLNGAVRKLTRIRRVNAIGITVIITCVYAFMTFLVK